MKSFRIHFRRMLRLVLGVEAAGVLLLFIGMLSHHDVRYGIWSAIFHSISAFCNAGFSFYTDSLIPFRGNWLVVGTVGVLIIIGGIGHPILFDLFRVLTTRKATRKTAWAKLSVHTKITILMTLTLLAAGFFILLVTAIPQMGLDIGAAAFQSITARTAGFNTIPIHHLPLASLLILVILMFIGGSPGSCAGGVKTTTFALWINQLWNRLHGKTHVVLQDRFIPEAVVRRSSTIISIAILWNVLGILILAFTERGIAGRGLHDILFEQISAFGTVGLSTGLTPELSQAGRLWIVATMFVGRTGPLTSVLLLLRKRPADIGYPEGKVMIG